MTILHIGHCYFSVQMTTLSLKNKAISYGFRNHKGHFYDTLMIFFLCVILMIFPNSIILKIVLWKKVILVQNNIYIFSTHTQIF